jgi:hypothetical protein
VMRVTPKTKSQWQRSLEKRQQNCSAKMRRGGSRPISRSCRRAVVQFVLLHRRKGIIHVSLGLLPALLLLLRHSEYSADSPASDYGFFGDLFPPCGVHGARLPTPEGRGSARSAAHGSRGSVRTAERRSPAESVSVGRAAGSSPTLPRTEFLPPWPTPPSIWRSAS